MKKLLLITTVIIFLANCQNSKGNIREETVDNTIKNDSTDNLMIQESVSKDFFSYDLYKKHKYSRAFNLTKEYLFVLKMSINVDSYLDINDEDKENTNDNSHLELKINGLNNKEIIHQKKYQLSNNDIFNSERTLYNGYIKLEYDIILDTIRTDKLGPHNFSIKLNKSFKDDFLKAKVSLIDFKKESMNHIK